jgi:CDP-glucose 4,6-dehydratase
MEKVELIMADPDSRFWKKKRVFVTGHTGFKGGWLCLWLQAMGAEVYGLSLEPNTPNSFFEEARVHQGMHSQLGDIRDLDTVLSAMQYCNPEIVFHMAAQPLVRQSYEKPVDTYATNVMGTLHVLEAVRRIKATRAVVNITTDKCYENKEWHWGYRENDSLGGHDPYSNSKACAELVSASYKLSFLQAAGVHLATARAGNVIGGGDWSEDRLVPDILLASVNSTSPLIRSPDSIRPWQHVLEPLCGYLVLAEKLAMYGDPFSQPWNFGPEDDDVKTVKWIVDYITAKMRAGEWLDVSSPVQPHEAKYLKLDISKAKSQLGWRPRWNLPAALDKTMEWHQAWTSGLNMREKSLEQIKIFSTTPIIGN